MSVEPPSEDLRIRVREEMIAAAWTDLHHGLQSTWIAVESGNIGRDAVADTLARVRGHARHIDRDVADEPERAKLLDRRHDQAIALALGAYT